MATNIVLKRSATQDAAPSTSDLALGEIALNTYDGKMYMKKTVSGTSSIVEITGIPTATSSAFAHAGFKYTADANQTTFTGSDANSETLSYIADQIQVFLNGVLLDATDYTASNGSSIVLGSGASANDILFVSAFAGNDPFSYFKYTATNAQTTFTGNDANSVSLFYTVGNLVVYLNGVLLDATDYTATNGTSIVLASGATTNDILVALEYNITGLTQVGNDSTPQLAGDLDLVTHDIVTTTNRNVNIIPHGTGDVNLSTDKVLIGASGENVTVTTNGTGDLTLNTNSGTNSGSIVIPDGANADITVTPNGSGKINLDGQVWPNALGSNLQYLQTNGSGVLSWVDVLDTSEEIQDTVGAMFSSNTETGITATYQDGDGTLDFVLATAQPTVTSLGTLTSLTVDEMTINGNTISANSGHINLTPASGSSIVLDATVYVDAGVVTGATSITSTAFVGTLSTAAQTNITSLGTLTGLTVQKAASGGSAGSNTVLVVEDDDNTELSILGGSSSVLAINFGHSGDVDDAIISYNTTSGSENMAFTVNAAERMRIDDSGNVGIGIATPNEGGFGATSNVLSIAGTAQDAFGVLELISTDVTSSNRIGEIRFGNLDAGSSFVSNAGIRATRDGADNSSALSLWYSNAGTFTEGLIIKADGNVGIGEASPANLLHVKVSDAGIAPHPSAQLVLERDGTNYLQFLTTAAGTSGLLFGDTNDIDVSKIYVDHNTTKMTFVNETSETMTLHGSKVGIGDSTPQDFLEVRSSGGIGGLTISNATHNQAALSFARSAAATARIFISEPGATHTSSMHFQTGIASGPALVTAMTIDETQNVIIGGGAAPRTMGFGDTRTQIEGITAQTSSLSIARNTDSSNGAYILLGKSRGAALGSNTVVEDGDHLGLIRFNAADGTDMANVGAEIKAVVDGTPGANDTPAKLEFGTTPDGSNSVTTRMTIRADGTVLIGAAEAATIKKAIVMAMVFG